MSEVVFSPDGKYMWTGSEWIPAPPNFVPQMPQNSPSQSGDIRDSVIMGDVNRQITNNVTTNVTSITAEEIGEAMAKAMQEYQSTNKAVGNGLLIKEIDELELPEKGVWMVPEDELSVTSGVEVINDEVAIFTSVWGKGCEFKSGTVIRDSVVISANFDYSCTVIDSLIAKDISVERNVMIDNCVIYPNVKIGENTILRNCVVKSGVEIPKDSNYEYVQFD